MHQDLSLIETFDVMENLFLNREVAARGWLGRSRMADKHKMRQRKSRDYRFPQALVQRTGRCRDAVRGTASDPSGGAA